MANPFKVGDRVKTATNTKLNGKVTYIACGLATVKGGKLCDKRTCKHTIKDNVWVDWPDGSKFSYHHTELTHDAAQVPAPPPTLPSAEMMKETSGDDKKDAYLDKAKKAIKDVISPAAKPAQQDFFRSYNGYDKIKYDRFGRPYLKSEYVPGPPIMADELNWDRYTGFNMTAPIRKIPKTTGTE